MLKWYRQQDCEIFGPASKWFYLGLCFAWPALPELRRGDRFFVEKLLLKNYYTYGGCACVWCRKFNFYCTTFCNFLVFYRVFDDFLAYLAISGWFRVYSVIRNTLSYTFFQPFMYFWKKRISLHKSAAEGGSRSDLPTLPFIMTFTYVWNIASDISSLSIYISRR